MHHWSFIKLPQILCLCWENGEEWRKAAFGAFFVVSRIAWQLLIFFFFGSIKAQIKLSDNVIWDDTGLTCACWTGAINLSVRSWFWLSEEMRYWRRLMYNQPCSLSRKLPPKKNALLLRWRGTAAASWRSCVLAASLHAKLPPPALSRQNFFPNINLTPACCSCI